MTQSADAGRLRDAPPGATVSSRAAHDKAHAKRPAVDGESEAHGGHSRDRRGTEETAGLRRLCRRDAPAPAELLIRARIEDR